MTKARCDILVAGGGPAGLIAAAAFGAEGFDVVLVDPAPPITEAGAAGADMRSTAFLRPARDLFERAGLWARLAGAAIPLEALRIVDTTGQPPQVRDERTFVATESGADPFGWNFLNWLIREKCLTHLADVANVRLKFGTGVAGLTARADAAIVRLTDGSRISARLVIAADGRNSAVREAAGIGVHTTRYGQKSLAFSATHERAHENISTEIYNRGGPFTMVPLADLDGKPASAIVWMNPGRRALDLLAMDTPAFNAAMTERSAGLFGRLELAGRRGIFPIITQRAERLAGQRVALIAEAAHVLPPIGAQGLNTSLNDVSALLQAAGHRGDPGAAEVLAAYEAARLRDIRNRARAIDLFNRVTRSGLPPLQSLRLAGLRVAHDVRPLRRGLMRAGMGPLGRADPRADGP